MSHLEAAPPDFFVVGAAKAGTTSLYHYLGQHPSIFMSPIKEPNYFCDDIDPRKARRSFAKRVQRQYEAFRQHRVERIHSAFIRDWAEYLSLFAGSGAGVAMRGEASASYLYSAVAALRIHSVLPHARVVICLRSPVDRAYSHYRMALRSGDVFLPFRAALRRDRRRARQGWGQSHLFVQLGLYASQVERYLDLFPRDQVFIIMFDDLVSDAAAVLARVFRFLGVDESVEVDTRTAHNRFPDGIGGAPPASPVPRSRRPANPLRLVKRRLGPVLFGSRPVHSRTRRYLLNVYEADIRRLANLLECDLSSWLGHRDPE